MREIDEYVPVGRNRRYHWDDWADGRWKLAVAGEDFSNAGTFRAALSNWVRDKHYTYQTELTPDGHVAFVIHPA